MATFINKQGQPITARCCLSIPPENIRKPLGFLMFSGSIDTTPGCNGLNALINSICGDVNDVINKNSAKNGFIPKCGNASGNASMYNHIPSNLPIFTCSKLTQETLEKDVEYAPSLQ